MKAACQRGFFEPYMANSNSQKGSNEIGVKGCEMKLGVGESGNFSICRK